MSIACRISGHRAEPGRIWNDGYYFGKCVRCAADLVRRGRDWQPVPKGFRIVWRPRTGEPMDWKPWTDVERAHPRLSNMVGRTSRASDDLLPFDGPDEMMEGEVRAWLTPPRENLRRSA